MRKRHVAAPADGSGGNDDLLAFAKKALIFSSIFSAVFAVALNLSLNQVLPDVHGVERLLEKGIARINSEFENDKNRLRLAGFLSRNPYVHYRMSVLEENAGQLDRAIEEIELALGLFELSPHGNPAREKYQRRLNELNKKRAALAHSS